MTVWFVILVIALAFVLLSQLRVGAKVEYSQSGVVVWVKVGKMLFQVAPPKKTKKKRTKKQPQPKRKTSAEKSEENSESKLGGSFALLRQALPVMAEGIGKLTRKIRVDLLQLEFTAAAPDPAMAAMAYGFANSAIGMIWPILEHNLTIRDYSIHIKADFQCTSPLIYLCLTGSIKVGQAIALAVALLVKFLHLYREYHKKQNVQDKEKKEAV